MGPASFNEIEVGFLCSFVPARSFDVHDAGPRGNARKLKVGHAHISPDHSQPSSILLISTGK